MNYENARTTLVSLVQSCVPPGMAVFWDNADAPDLTRVGDAYILVEFYWDDAGQKTMESNPIHRTTGSIYTLVFSREGTGTKVALQAMDALTAGLKFKSNNGLVTSVPKPGRRQKADGWASQELHTPFYFDSTP